MLSLFLDTTGGLVCQHDCIVTVINVAKHLISPLAITEQLLNICDT